MNTRQTPPSMLLRLLLSHLLVVLACFVAAILLFDYLFAPGVNMFLVRHPIIIIPTVLILIGIAGLAANWTSAAIALPIDYLASKLASNKPDLIAHVPHHALGSEEGANLHAALLRFISVLKTRAAATALIDVTIDPDLMIIPVVDTDDERTGGVGDRLSFIDLYVRESDAPAALYALSSHLRVAALGDAPAFAATWEGPTQRIAWVAFTLYGDDGRLRGMRMLGRIAEARGPVNP